MFCDHFSGTALMAAALLVVPSAAQKTSPPATWTGKGYNVAGVGTFNSFFQIDFSKLSDFPSSLDISTNTVGAGNSPYARTFSKSNIRMNRGDSVSLLVQPKVIDGSIPSGEFSTGIDDILYGSVRTVAKASNVSGTCHGFFSYLDDNQETDIEILTKNLSKVWFTNQALSPGTDETSTTASAPATIASAYHEYRIDWLQDRTVFYIDGVKKAELTTNVPNKPTSWLWNNWANGNPKWSAGPPAQISDLRIQSITAYWNRTSVAVAQPPPGNSSTLTTSTKTATTKSSNQPSATVKTAAKSTKSTTTTKSQTTKATTTKKSAGKKTTAKVKTTAKKAAKVKAAAKTGKPKKQA
ncbi:Beta-glucanase [Elsinoe australis]|uniref:Beta-glucanase n=1 Tax=Elsinoe australis TaxID=40998 RepID=A0A2P8A8A9_9PEZI|nr:Beta-glucanase [Elsinoe australis]